MLVACGTPVRGRSERLCYATCMTLATNSAKLVGRLYGSFWTQWPVGSAEFSDVPMTRPPEEDTHYDFFKAKYTTQYLEEYIDQRKFAGQTLRERIKFGFEVRKVQKVNDEWLISGTYGGNGEVTLKAPKVIVASGITSKPNMPVLPGKEKFEGILMHQESYGQSSVLSSAEVKHITVIGAGKSAADMVYESAKAGKSVSWLISKSGTGPGFFLSPKGKGPYKNIYAIGSTRVAATLSPSFFNVDNWWTRFLNGTNLGRNLISTVWGSADKEMKDFEGKSATPGFEKLVPHSPLFWQNMTGGLLHRPDFWDTIAESVYVYVDDILELDKKTIRLKAGEEITTDAILCGTGWKPALDMFDQETLIQLGLPYPLEQQPPEVAEKWVKLEKEADQKVLKSLPLLANPPENYYRKANPSTPYRLYKGMAPIHDDSIVFVGHVVVGNYFRTAECQAVWATAYLDKKIPLPSAEEQEAEIALLVAWCKRRYLSNGEMGHWLVFDMTGYCDKLLEQVGLSSHLQKGWLSYYFRPGVARDLVGLRAEYVGRYGGDDEGKVGEGESEVSAG
jgi:dimethylaniline monooxygenase (N-oxide forming)